MISSTGYFLGTWLVPSGEIGAFGPVYGAVGNHATCSLSGFLAQMTIASPLYNGSLSLYYLLTIKYNWPDARLQKIEKWLHILPLGYAYVSSFIALGLDMYGNFEWLCWIKPDVADDDDGGRVAIPTNAQKNYVIFQWVFLFGPLWVTILFASLVFYVLYRKVKENEKRMEKYKFSLTTSSGGSFGGGGSGGGGPISTTTISAAGRIHGPAAAVAEDEDGSTAVSHPRLSLFGASLKQQKKKEKSHRCYDDNHDDLVEAMEEKKDDFGGMVGNYRLLMTNDKKIYYRKNKSKNSSGSSSSLLHDDGWRALRKKRHNYEVHDESKQDQRTQHHHQQETIMLVKNGDNLEVKEQEKKSPTSHSSCHEQNTKNHSAMKDDNDDDDVDQHFHCNSKVSDFHGDGEVKEEEQGETQLTLDEEMAIKYAANATMMTQNTTYTAAAVYTNNTSSGTYHNKTVPDGGDKQDELGLISASHGDGKRRSVTFSSRATMIKKASISSNHSARASCHSQSSLPASDRSSQSSIMGLSSTSALNKKKKKWYEKASKSRQIAIQGILYSCAFYFTWFFPTVQRSTELAANTNYYVVQFLECLLLPLQGLFNFAIYIRPRFIAFQSSNPQAGFWRSLREVTCDNS